LLARFANWGILTAAIIGKETDILLDAGADAVLNKPLDIHEMKRTIAVLENKVDTA
jgi:DNA-binding response OmpR family regulator